MRRPDLKELIKNHHHSSNLIVAALLTIKFLNVKSNSAMILTPSASKSIAMDALILKISNELNSAYANFLIASGNFADYIL